MGSRVQEKPHIICIPFPAQGHINPFMQLAKLLHSRGFHITFVNTEFNHRRLLRSKGPEALNGLNDFRFETIPDGLPPSDKDATQDVPSLCYSVQRNCLAPLKDLIIKLNSSSGVPPVTRIISDGIMSFAIQAGVELGIPEVIFWTASACGFMGYLQYKELVKREIVPFKDDSYNNNGYLDTQIDWVPGMKDIRLKDLPSFLRTTDIEDIMFNFLGEEAQNCLNSSTIIFNTFDSLEQEVLEAISSIFPHIYTMGPLSLLSLHIGPKSEIKSISSSLWKEDIECLRWLDMKEPKSVIYVNFGSVTVMSDHHLREFAWGLANSKKHFLWIIRNDVVMGNSAILPKEFTEEIQDRGLITSWCPQEKVLSHSSIGLFLTHMGWNSTIETICGGVPVICWPFFAEQQTNCRYACVEWGFGMEINNDVKREEVESLIKVMIEGEKGKEKMKKAMEWKEEAKEATKQGGPSYINLDRLIKEVLLPRGQINN